MDIYSAVVTQSFQLKKKKNPPTFSLQVWGFKLTTSQP